MFSQKVAVVLVVVCTAFGANSTSKRGIYDTGFGGFNSFDSFGPNHLVGAPVIASPPVDFGRTFTVQKSYSVSPAEIAGAIQAAKEASASVMAAQQRVQEAKEAVLHQQHIASQKQAQAALALQKTEAAAAVQQQEAKSAATALVQAQQRLAHAKAEVAEQQRIASAKESHAAAVIQKSAAAAAVEIQKSDEAAMKISALQHSGASALRQVSAAKQGTLTATSAAVAASSGHSAGGDGNSGPWYTQKYVQIQPWG